MLEAFYQVGASSVFVNGFVPVIADCAQDQNHAHVVVNEVSPTLTLSKSPSHLCLLEAKSFKFGNASFTEHVQLSSVKCVVASPHSSNPAVLIGFF